MSTRAIVHTGDALDILSTLLGQSIDAIWACSVKEQSRSRAIPHTCDTHGTDISHYRWCLHHGRSQKSLLALCGERQERGSAYACLSRNVGMYNHPALLQFVSMPSSRAHSSQDNHHAMLDYSSLCGMRYSSRENKTHIALCCDAPMPKLQSFSCNSGRLKLFFFPAFSCGSDRSDVPIERLYLPVYRCRAWLRCVLLLLRPDQHSDTSENRTQSHVSIWLPVKESSTLPSHKWRNEKASDFACSLLGLCRNTTCYKLCLSGTSGAVDWQDKVSRSWDINAQLRFRCYFPCMGL